MERMIIEFTPECKGIIAALGPLLDLIHQTCALAHQGAAIDYARVEEQCARCASEIERASHQTLWQALDIDAPQIRVDGRVDRRVLRQTGRYYTMAGDVAVDRTPYWEQGQCRGAVVGAVSLRAGVVGSGWLPWTAQAMAFTCQSAPAREAAQTSRRWLRLPYSRCAFEDVTHAVAEQYAMRRPSTERALVEATPIAEEARSLSVSLDLVSVPMEEPRPRPVGRPGKKEPSGRSSGSGVWPGPRR